MQNFDFFSLADFALSVSEANQQVKDLLESDPVLEDISVKEKYPICPDRFPVMFISL